MAHTLTFIREVPKVPKAKLAKIPKGKRQPDPSGRVDLLAIRLLEVAVSVYGDVPLRTIYGTYKKEIDQTLKRKLGKIRMYVPPAGQVQGGGHAA